MNLRHRLLRVAAVLTAKDATIEEHFEAIRWYIADIRKIARSQDYDEIGFILTRIQDVWRDNIQGGRAPKAPGAKSKPDTLLRYADAMTKLVDAKAKELGIAKA